MQDFGVEERASAFRALRNVSPALERARQLEPEHLRGDHHLASVLAESSSFVNLFFHSL